MKQGFKFFYAVAVVLLTGYICSKLTHIGLTGWYDNFDKPPLTPPDKVFPIAWSIIYALQILAAFIALRYGDSGARGKANNLFIAQLALQILWCFAFFAQGQLALGMAIILLLDIVVYKMVIAFGKIRKIAGWLLYPYYWWLVFATFLNAVFISYFGLIVVF